jgi:hypothetical protein
MVIQINFKATIAVPVPKKTNPWWPQKHKAAARSAALNVFTVAFCSSRCETYFFMFAHVNLKFRCPFRAVMVVSLLQSLSLQ